MIDGNAILLGLTIIGVLAILEIPVIIAYMRGVRGHKLNIVLMVTGLGALPLAFHFYGVPNPVTFIWIVALAMAFVYKPFRKEERAT